MNKTTELHDKAMEFWDEGFFAKREGKTALANEKFRKALELETQAAERLKNKLNEEPSRSVLYRSAASMAMSCKEYRQAEKLIATALAGNPPEEIAEELRDLLEEVNLRKKSRIKSKQIERGKLMFADEIFEVSGFQIGEKIYLRELSKLEG
jgi:tetratricopeptide (TPR) repeat protein